MRNAGVAQREKDNYKARRLELTVSQHVVHGVDVLAKPVHDATYRGSLEEDHRRMQYAGDGITV